MYKEASGLHRLLQPVVEAMGYELIGVERLAGHRSSLVRVYIDCDAGVTLTDCGRVSHQISGVLDVEDPIRGHYTLEVSSPGWDRPLFTREHFERFTGSTVRMELSQALGGRRRLTGQLARIEGDSVVMLENGQQHRVPFTLIAKTRLVPQAN